jgi:Transglycosylase SLT domain
LGVPDFFISSFAIPPFLLPIYQAAGIEYDVPWQVLAAINEIETDYGRNLSVSSAGAVGWMQFLPSTWKVWGVDATGSGYADPYNPVDAIFAAARYLHAAGASRDLSKAIFAYNHASWYVQSVLLRAKLIGGMPNSLVSALTGLVEGHFPVAARARYADDYVEQLARGRVGKGGAAVAVDSNPREKAIAIYARRGAPVIAVNDGRVLRLGRDRRWGRYLELQDSNGNVYTYADLGSVPRVYPVPKPVSLSAAGVVKALGAGSASGSLKSSGSAGGSGSAGPTAPATAGSQNSAAGGRGSGGSGEAALALPSSPESSGQTGSGGSQGLLPASLAEPAPQVKQRLFAYPSRAASFAAGGGAQLRSERAAGEIQNFQNYFSGVLHLAKNQYTLKPLRRGSEVVAGTILGRIGAGTKKHASHLEFMVKPGGNRAPYVDPKPILDGWELLQATSIYRASGIDPFVGKDPSIGQILLMSKLQLQQRVLSDPRVSIYPCGRRDIATGQIDRRVLGDIEFLSASGLKPYISGLKCGASKTGSNGIDPAGKTGESMDISKVNNIPIAGHSGQGSITDITIRRLLTLQGIYKPTAIISAMSFKNHPNTLSLPRHKNRIQIAYTPMLATNNNLSNALNTILKPRQWIQLIQRLNQIPEPTVPINPSKYAIKK